MKQTTLELMLTFDEPDTVAIERVVATYLAKGITRREMAEQVRAVVGQYDAISQGLAYTEIEDVIGEEVDDFWRRPRKKARRRATRGSLASRARA